MLTGKAVAQSVTVDATIDSLQIYIGDQAKIKLQVALDADKRAIFPVYTDTLVSGVEIIDVAKPDTQYINDDKRMLITQEYTVTSFDSASVSYTHLAVKGISGHFLVCTIPGPCLVHTNSIPSPSV